MDTTLETLLLNFKKEAYGLSSFQIASGDAKKPLVYIAVRAFKGKHLDYEKWLVARHSNLGTLTALELLSKENESLAVKDALMQKWLTEEGLVVERPKISPLYEKVTAPGGFTSWRPIEQPSPTQ